MSISFQQEYIFFFLCVRVCVFLEYILQVSRIRKVVKGSELSHVPLPRNMKLRFKNSFSGERSTRSPTLAF